MVLSDLIVTSWVTQNQTPTAFAQGVRDPSAVPDVGLAVTARRVFGALDSRDAGISSPDIDLPRFPIVPPVLPPSAHAMVDIARTNAIVTTGLVRHNPII